MRKIFIVIALLLTQFACSLGNPLYSRTTTVDISAERRAELEADLEKWDAFIRDPSSWEAQNPNLPEQPAEEATIAGGIEIHTPEVVDPRPQFDFFVEKARALTYLGRIGEALKVYDEAFELYENSATGWHNRARLYEELGENEKAIADYEKIIETFRLKDYYLDITKVYWKMGDITNARRNYILYERETGKHDLQLKQKLGILLTN